MDVFMINKIIWRLPEVMAQTGLCRSVIYDLISQDKFPAQVNLGARTVGWVSNEIVDWIDARIAESRASEHSDTTQYA